jgi:hypothetical protein
MLIEAEVALLVVALALYLYDSIVLLDPDEGVLTPKFGGWEVSLGSKVQWRGKDLFLPSPLFPYRPVFRARWSFAQVEQAGAPNWAENETLLRPLAPLVVGMAFALFVVFPLGLFRYGDLVVLAAIAMLYLNIIGALIWLAFNRKVLGLSRGRVAGLGIEALVCSPFGLNLIRKISADMPVNEDLVHAARRLQSKDDWDVTRMKFALRIEDEIGAEDGGSPRAQALQEHRKLLMEGL